MRLRYFKALSCCAVFALLALGCSQYQKPKYPVEDRRILLVPFRDLAVAHGHGFGESKRGQKVAEALRAWAESNWAPNFADAPTTESVVRQLREWPREKILPRDWARLLTGLDTELVLLGEIRKLSTQDPRAIGFYRGTIEGGFFVIDAATGRELYRSSDIKLEFPPPKDLSIPISDFEKQPEEIEQGLVKVLGERVARDLYGYYAEGR